MSFENPSREQIGDILASAGNIAVVGLSDKTDRTSYMVAGAMQSRGYRIIPVNPTVDGEILGEKCYHTLAEIQSQWTSSMYSVEANTAQRSRRRQLTLAHVCCGSSRV